MGRATKDGNETVRGRDATSETDVRSQVGQEENEQKDDGQGQERQEVLLTPAEIEANRLHDLLDTLPEIGTTVFLQEGVGDSRRVCPATVLERAIQRTKNDTAPTVHLFVKDWKKPMGPFVQKWCVEGYEVGQWSRDLELAKAKAGYDKRIKPALNA